MRYQWIGCGALLLCGLVACGPGPSDADESAFLVACGGKCALGGPSDPVLQMALEQAASANVQLIVQNASLGNYREGLMTFAPVAESGSAASAALDAYLLGGSATDLASGLGLTLGS